VTMNGPGDSTGPRSRAISSRRRSCNTSPGRLLTAFSGRGPGPMHIFNYNLQFAVNWVFTPTLGLPSPRSARLRLGDA